MIFFKTKLKEIRESRGLTLSQVANACNVSQSMVSRWEKEGKSCPLPAKIPKLAALLHCSESDLAQFGPMEKALDSLNERHEQIQNMFFGADVGDEIDMIERALDSRDRISSSDPDYENELAEENAEIRENLHSIFRKMSRALNVADLPEDALDDFRFGLLRALIKSDMSPEEKNKALQIVEKFGQEN